MSFPLMRPWIADAPASIPPHHRLGPMEEMSGLLIDSTIWDDPANLPQMDYRIMKMHRLGLPSIYEIE